ncbi:hypothetical protein RF55_8967 [Lasius niger]|uniref:Uncharacterized protein n=1 Tax=Lasius niger TaxID=67767 RepID=A0A0J7KLC0_LASNI|nr:hypothetical protein RF55_8967 [Lasius niger]
MKDHHVVRTKRHVHLRRRDGWMDTRREGVYVTRLRARRRRRRRRRNSKRCLEEEQEKRKKGGDEEVRELTVRLGSMRFFL